MAAMEKSMDSLAGFRGGGREGGSEEGRVAPYHVLGYISKEVSRRITKRIRVVFTSAWLIASSP